jgi:hypothetical protein
VRHIKAHYRASKTTARRHVGMAMHTIRFSTWLLINGDLNVLLFTTSAAESNYALFQDLEDWD